MGNELFSQYSIEKTHYLTGGHLNLWKIYRGTHKTRHQKVSVFVFEKKDLDQFPKNEHEAFLSILKNEASSLVKFKHPNILSIVEQLLEDKYSIGFVTEEIAYSLSTWAQTNQYSALEIKIMVNELSNTIAFLQNNCNIIHTNLNPDGIFISNELHVKVSSLNFALKNSNDQDMPCMTSSKSFLNRNLSYVAPEIVYSSKGTSKSDTFSLGLLLCFLIKSLNGEANTSLLDLSNNIPEDYKRAYNCLENRLNAISSRTPADKRLITAMLKKDDKQRISIDEVLKHDFFADNRFQALLFIQNIPTTDIKKTTDFFKNYPVILPLFEQSIISKYFLPSLLNNLKIDSLTNILLPNVFETCESPHSMINFEEIVWPKLNDLFQMKTIPAASLYFLLLKMPYIAEKISSDEFSTHCMSIICKAMDCGVVKIQTAVADALPFVALKIAPSEFKSHIYPRVLQILANTTSSGLKAKLLGVISKVAASLDQSIINESLLNFLDLLCQKDASYSICACVVKIYEEIERTVSINAITKKIIPNLIAILSNGVLSSILFDTVTILIERLLMRIKSAREKELIKEPQDEVIKSNAMNEKEKGGLKDMSTEKRERVLAALFQNQSDASDKGIHKVNEEELDPSDKNDNNKDKEDNQYVEPKPLLVLTPKNKTVKEVNQSSSSSLKPSGISDHSKPNKLEKKQKTNIATLQSPESDQTNDNNIFDVILREESINHIKEKPQKNKTDFNQWDDDDDDDDGEDNAYNDYCNEEEAKKRVNQIKPIEANLKTPKPKIEESVKAQNAIVNNLDSLLND